jgi:glycosyltransferase involved in cell wall biosynthesis
MIRIGIDARVPDERSGGVRQVILGLASGLSNLSDGDEEFVFVTYAGRDDWLRPAVTGRCRIEAVPFPATSAAGLHARLKALPRLASLTQKAYHLVRLSTGNIRPRPSSGVFEKLGVGVVHFPLQSAELVNLPNIYHPHDLQYIHYPTYFTAYERKVLDVTYRAYIHNATAVAVASSWVKQDLIESLGCPEMKIFVVPLAPPNTVSEYLRENAEGLALPDQFFFYPAQTWPHNNHSVLIDALATLHARRSELRLHLVFSGAGNAHRILLEKQIRTLGLETYIHFLGYITPAQLSETYRRCIACVIPSFFEAASFPAWEAFFAGAPVAAAHVTSLPAQIGDAGLLFDPQDSDTLSQILEQLATDEALRQKLITRGHQRIRALSWQHTALHFRSLYRLLANQPLDAQDRDLLAAAPSL